MQRYDALKICATEIAVEPRCTKYNMKKVILTIFLSFATGLSCLAQGIPHAITEQSIKPRTFTNEMLDADITQSNISETICRKGYTKTVRPSTIYTNGVKMRLLREAGLSEADASEYELDHIVPLALGGHPRKPSNLMLQPWEGREGAKQKDRLERKMQNMVCNGEIALTSAQREIATDWVSSYSRYIRHK